MRLEDFKIYYALSTGINACPVYVVRTHKCVSLTYSIPLVFLHYTTIKNREKQRLELIMHSMLIKFLKRAFMNYLSLYILLHEEKLCCINYYFLYSNCGRDSNIHENLQNHSNFYYKLQ